MREIIIKDYAITRKDYPREKPWKYSRKPAMRTRLDYLSRLIRIL